MQISITMLWALSSAALSGLYCLFPRGLPVEGPEPVLESTLMLLHYPMSFLAVVALIIGLVELFVTQGSKHPDGNALVAKTFPARLWVFCQVALVLGMVNCHRLLQSAGVEIPRLPP